MNFDRLRKTATLRLGESAKVSLPVLVMALVLGALASYLFIQSHNEGIETEASRGDEAAEAAALEAAAQSAPPPRSLFEVVARARNSRSSGQMGPSGPFLSTERGQLTCAVGILIG